MSDSLVATLKGLRGNPRACVYTEPLWGLSINLCLPYATVYMLAIGLNDFQVGLIATVYTLSQVVFAFLSGPLIDKLGRRKATAFFDFFAWCVPCLIWWRAGNFWFFFAAALVNGTMMIPTNAWDCLLVEDAERSEITRISSLIEAFAQLSVLFAPISAILFSRLGLVSAIRVLYINAFFVMTLKVTLLYFLSRETGMGIIRVEESRGKSLLSLAAGYRGIFRIIGASRGTIFALVITALAGIVGMINTSFWQIIVSQKLLVPYHLLPLFPVLRSLVAIVFLFFVIPFLAGGDLKLPLLAGFLCYFIGQTLLVLTPGAGFVKYLMLCVSLVFDGFGSGSLLMLARSLVALNVNRDERARVQAILKMIVMTVTSPFGWIAGLLSGVSRNLPFVLTMCLLAAGFLATIIYYINNRKEKIV